MLEPFQVVVSAKQAHRHLADFIYQLGYVCDQYDQAEWGNYGLANTCFVRAMRSLLALDEVLSPEVTRAAEQMRSGIPWDDDYAEWQEQLGAALRNARVFTNAVLRSCYPCSDEDRPIAVMKHFQDAEIIAEDLCHNVKVASETGDVGRHVIEESRREIRDWINRECPEVLPQPQREAIEGSFTSDRDNGELPAIEYTPPSTNGQTAAADGRQPITTKDAAKLVQVEHPTFNNKKSHVKENDPAPCMLKNTYDYRELRPWLCRQWPEFSGILPESWPPPENGKVSNE